MGLKSLVLCALVALILATPLSVFAQSTAPASQPSKAVVIVLQGTIDDYNKAALMQRFEQARKLGADTIVLQIDTYGGLVTAGLEISQFLKRQDDLHVIAFVHEKAISAGAMIALACNEIVMEPNSKLGDCAPIVVNSAGSGLESVGAAERAKMESPILADFYDSAVRNGYDPTLVQSMVSVGRIVHWIENDSGERKFVDGAIYDSMVKQGWKPVAGVRDPIDSADELLTVWPDLALKLGLAKAIEPSPEVLAQARGFTIVDTLSPSAGEAIIALLSSSAVRALLTTVFLFALYTSFSHPGHGMAEVIAVVSLALLAGVPLLTGYAQWWEILAILIGILLLALEVFVIPGFGITGISGILLVLVGLTMTWVGKEPLPGLLPRLQGTQDALKHGVMIVVGGMACSLLLWFWLQRYLPRLPYFNRLILTTPSGSVASIDPTMPGAVQVVAWPALGSRGKAMTDLRPGGSAAFHDETIGDARITDVISDSGYVRAGTDVIVREVQGMRVVVRAVTSSVPA
jgi:membrane-bound serine protease (ClpP class)